MGFGMGLSAVQVRQLGKIMSGLYRLFREKDLSLIEVNPLIIDKNQNLLALDAKINADDNALFRHPDLAAMRDEAQEDPTEVAASRHDLNYVTLDGNIACMVNGAGLAMATMDVIKLEWRRARQFPGCGRRIECRACQGSIQVDFVQRSGGSHPGQYFWGHRALR